ncbi:MAG: acyl-CoA dehydrogenase family protein [Novosphingobium sp.]|nr:acyl-CoA dehydrogenase family protein [Novosphingobium sp.]
MALVLSEEETMIADTARGLFARHAPVSAFRALRDSKDPLAQDRELLRRLAQAGLVAPNVTQEAGGLGLGVMASGLILEQAGHVLAAVPLLSSAIAGALLAAIAGRSEQERLIPPSCQARASLRLRLTRQRATVPI